MRNQSQPTGGAILRETAGEFLALLFSPFWLKLAALGACPVALIILAKAALS